MSHPLLPEALQVHLPGSLEDNRANFPEFTTVVDAQKVLRARDRLLNLSLLHTTIEDFQEDIQAHGLLPVSELTEDSYSNTFGLDRDLGLDEAVFFGWGTFHDRPRGLWVCAEPELLLDEQVIVSPADINLFAFAQDKKFKDLPAERQRSVQKGYFDRTLTGTDWLDMMSRRIALQRSPKVEMSHFALGEIKVFRNIKPDELSFVNNPTQKQAIADRMYQAGFVAPHRG